MKNQKLKLSAAQSIAIGFALIIIMGALLLYLPFSSAKGTTTSFIDALFTATTSVCVTGLVTVPTAYHWSTFGKIVILILIQLGGLGVTACIMGSFVLARKKITLKNRKLIQETYNLDHLSGVVRMIRNIAIGTFTAEAIGAVLYAIQFVPEYGVRGIGISIFNAISAFCNAGMDIIGDNSLESYVTNPLVNFTTMGLIVTGGIGFIVWWDIHGVFKMVKRKDIQPRLFFSKLSLHSKMAISCTLFLLVIGTILFFLAEYKNEATFGNLTTGQKWMAALFESVTTRTAGFGTVNQGNLTDLSISISLVLMFIGGSPMGTAGGMKTTTIAILILVVLAYLHGKKDTETFKRRVSEENIRTAIVVVMVGFCVLFLGINLVVAVTDFDFLDIVFEVTSAIGTVGLTRGITSDLPTIAKAIIIVIMYIGRIGPITLAMAITVRSKQNSTQIRLPERKILIG